MSCNDVMRKGVTLISDPSGSSVLWPEMTSDPGGDEGHRQLTGFWVRSFVVRQTGLAESGGGPSVVTPDSVRAAGGRLMWPIPSHETELRLNSPDPVPMGTLWRRQEVT